MSKARVLAEKKHTNLYDEKSYMIHLDGVVAVGRQYLSKIPHWKSLEDLLYLHDIKEDTDVTDEEILEVTNEMVLHWINLITDKEGRNRKERHLNTYPYIRRVEVVVLAKLCDRIFNIRYSLSKKNDKTKMYLKEADTFKAFLYEPEHSYAKKMWNVYDEEIKKLKDFCWKKRK